MKFLICLASLGAISLSTTATPCTAAHFTQSTGQAYLAAESALLDDDDPARAADILTTLQGSGLNCYETLAVHKMKAAALVSQEKYEAAIAELAATLDHPLMSADERAEANYNIGQLYLSLGDETAAARYLGSD